MEHHRRTSASHARDDAQVLKAVQDTLRGDASAFETIVKKYSSPVYSLAYRMLGNGEDAEEAVQEIFLRLYRSLSRFQLTRQFRPWLYSIAANYLRSVLRKRRRRYAIGTVSFSDTILHKPGMTSSIDPAALIESREAERFATVALQNLRPEHREVLILRQMENLSVREVAEILGRPEGTVKIFLHRAKKKLIEFLTEQGWSET